MQSLPCCATAPSGKSFVGNHPGDSRGVVHRSPNIRMEFYTTAPSMAATTAPPTRAFVVPMLPRVLHAFLSTNPMHTLVSTLNGHRDSITATQFSPNGAYLASCSEDGLLLIHLVGKWKPLLRFIDASPITALAWHPRFKRLFFCGCKSGDVHIIRFSTTGVRPHPYQYRILVLTNKTARRSCLDRRNAGTNKLLGTQ